MIEYQIRRVKHFLRRYLRRTDLIDVATIVVASILAAKTATNTAIVLSTSYVILVLLKWFLDVRHRTAEDAEEAEVIWGIFHLLDATAFGGENSARFTVFREDPYNSERIVPWYRYEHGDRDCISSAMKSRASYKKGQGYTGKAWTEERDNDWQIAIIPQFSGREEMEDFYTTHLGVERTVAQRISDYMTGVGIILSCRLCDTRGKFLGLVSVDLRWHVESYEPLNLVGQDGEQRELGTEALVTLLLVLHNVMRSFAHAKK